MSATKPKKTFGGILLLTGLALFGGAWSFRHMLPRASGSADEIALLVPDKTDFADPMVTLWLDAGSEEGLHIAPIHDSDFLRATMGGPHFKGIILPDTVHRSASDVLVGGISRYVEQGGALLLAGDAGVLDQNNVYPRASSRFSRLAGLDYAFYDELREKSVVWGKVWGNRKVLDDLEVPPGVAIPQTTDLAGEPDDLELTGYGEQTLLYPGFVTRGTYDGQVLLQSPSGITAGLHKVRDGNVLYVNLPLGYLKARTDGLLLHAFLRYFAKTLLQLPSLLAVPDGIGGLVLNWHLDSNAALAPLSDMQKAGIFDQGPYSIHLTAGPDARKFADGLGLNVDGDPAIENWIRYFSQHGHAVGSHGGWIHDYFGLHASEDNQKDFERFLVLNREALEKVMGSPVREYSAPVGNQPQWVTRWLQQRGILAYYFTGNAGMAPTQTYREDRKADIEGWSFPISHLGRSASFEEMSKDELPDAEILRWLEALSAFCAERHTVRLFYSHPPGVIPYLPLFQRWMKNTAELNKEGNFRWYTMSQLADFLNRRRNVKWQIVKAENRRQRLLAQSPKGLSQMAWMLPASIYGEPRVVDGSVAVQRKPSSWLVTARSGEQMTLELPLQRNAGSGEGQ